MPEALKPLLPAKKYSPDKGDEFVLLWTIGPEHKERVFEIRRQDDDGKGWVGRIADAHHYMIEGLVFIRLWGDDRGSFELPDAKILMKSVDYVVPSVAPTD